MWPPTSGTEKTISGYLQLLHDMIEQHGCPIVLYHDKDRIFVNPDPETIDAQLASQPALTQVGRALDEHGFTPSQYTPHKPGGASILFAAK